MVLPDIDQLKDPERSSLRTSCSPRLSESKAAPEPDRYMEKLAGYAKSLPYAIEPPEEILAILDNIILRLIQAVHARDEVGLIQWDSMLS